MRNNIYITLLLLFSLTAFSQDKNTISTATPFLSISPDGRSTGMGDVGVSTAADEYSQYWNSSKYVFLESSSGLAISYTPWLSELADDIFVGHVVGHYKIGERGVLGSSFRYFSLGQINLTDNVGNELGSVLPNELAIDISYNLKLDKNFAMGLSMRYINSSIAKVVSWNASSDAKSANSVAFDLSGYYQGDYKRYSNFDGRFSFGWNISNIGLKVAYNENATEDQKLFLPANLKLGAGYSFKFDDYNTLNLNLEAAKLLVPTPPIYDTINGSTIISGKDPNVSVIQGAMQSFYDAPGGFSEEFKEIMWSFGAEYVYDNTIALRTGYFYEDSMKGDRKYATLGVGFKYSSLGLDFSYLINTSPVRSPLENTMRFSITIDFDSFSFFDDDTADSKN